MGAWAVAAQVANGLVQGIATKNAADAQAAALGDAADASRRAAGDARLRGDADAQTARLGASQAVADTKVQIASNGQDVGSEAGLSMADVTRMLSNRDVGTIRANAAREAWGHEIQARDYEAQRRIAKKAGKVGLVTSFLGGAMNGSALALQSKGK